MVKTVYLKQPNMSIGAQLGDKLQKFASSAFSRIFGMGDYEISDKITDVSKNSMLGATMKPPSFAPDGRGTFVFEHNEYCGDVVSAAVAGGFKADSYVISPTNPDLFPWLSSMASNFEFYQIEGLMFRFVSTSGESVSSVNTALGQVMMYVNPDVYDETPNSKQVILQYAGVVDAKPSKNILVAAECDPKQMVSERFYVGEKGADRRFNQFGQLVVATNGLPGTSVVAGELWVHYRIRFSVAKVPDNDVGGLVRCASIKRTTASSTSFLGTTTILYKTTLPNFSISDNTISFDVDSLQNYLVNIVWNTTDGNSWTLLNPGISFNGFTTTNWFRLNDNTDAPTFGISSDRQQLTFVVQALSGATRGTITFGNSGPIPPANVVDINITRITR